ncbi:MAG TPA: aminotransferase class V-fold PLP-dependent enzyme, partial [Spirochaetales bacterium]|nr:aminotransferase class V-fold PLP-dependent enzyme [Spirochaetales bacterium]
LPLGRTAGDGRYSPFILSIAFPGLSGEVFARALADEGVAVSTGAACSANARKKGRRILEAMGLEAGLAFSAIRVSTGPATAPEEIDRFLETADALYRRLKT